MGKTFKTYFILILSIAIIGIFNAKVFATPNTKKAAKTTSLSFIENKGQVTDQNNMPRPDIDFRLPAASGLTIFVGDGAIHYQFSKKENTENRLSSEEVSPKVHDTGGNRYIM